MPRKPTGMPNGRPKIAIVQEEGLKPREINLDQVIYWIELQASCQEIAASFRVSTDTLVRRIKENFGMTFAELKERCDGSAKLSLRRFQFKLAEKNATMAIWLGKQWLGQKDSDRIDEQQAKKGFEEFNRIVGQLTPSLAPPLAAPVKPQVEASVKAQMARVVPMEIPIEA